MKRKIQLVGILLVIGLVVLLVVQNKSLTRLQTENDKLREDSQQLDQLREENERLAKLSANTNELERLRKEHGDLLRLRGEIGSLREKLKSATLVVQQQKQMEISPADAVPDYSTNDIKKYESTVSTTLPSGFSVATGGWEMQPGKYTLALVTPTIGADGTVEVRTRFAEMGADSFDALGLKDFKTDGTQSKRNGIFTAEKTAALLKAFEETAGVDILSAPSVTTSSGHQAQVSVVDDQTISGEKHLIGPVVDIVPSIRDGNSVDITVQINYTRLLLPQKPDALPHSFRSGR